MVRSVGAAKTRHSRQHRCHRSPADPRAFTQPHTHPHAAAPAKQQRNCPEMSGRSGTRSPDGTGRSSAGTCPPEFLTRHHAGTSLGVALAAAPLCPLPSAECSVSWGAAQAGHVCSVTSAQTRVH